jgi:integrase/recombinase XerD
VFEEYRNTNPTDLLETPKIGEKLPDTLSQNEINELFKSFRTIYFWFSFS